ncbi:MAG: diguanylate cyclase [Burkholderiales bacterium]|nr:diguanylate cyclase [Burkholderiales bacterium]
MNILQTLRRWSEEDQRVQEAAYRRNLHVLGITAWGMVALNLLHVAVFALLDFGEPVRDAWARQIAQAHGAMALLMLALGWWSRRLQARTSSRPWQHALPALTAVLVLAWAVALTLMDQAVSTSINAFVNAAVGIAIVFLLRPRSALAILVVAWCALAWTLGWTTQDQALLTTNRMNAASACILAALVSSLLWRRYVQTELLQRALADTNEQLERQQVELQALATLDPLTGLLNRRAFVRAAEAELARARRQGSPLSLLMLDLDHFKSINDHFGHPKGDEVLREVARLMTHTVRHTDRIARYGGEEFILLLPDTSEAHALHLAEKLRQTLANTTIAHLATPVTASIGLACLPVHSTMDLDTLLQHVDCALYEAKHQGRNRCVVAPMPAPRSVLTGT